MTDGNLFCVYKHTSPSGKSYIGISNNPEKRWNHGKGYIKNYRFTRAINKYGWDAFTHEILYEGLSAGEAAEIEQRLIDEMKLTDFKYGYNLRDGGDGTFCEESRKRMSRSRMGNQNSKGHHHTDDERKAVSDGLKRYYATHENPNKGKEQLDKRGENSPFSIAVSLLDDDGNVVKTFPALSEAARETGCRLQKIWSCCNGYSGSTNGMRWKYADDRANIQKTFRKNFKGENNPSAKPVECRSLDGTLIETFPYATLGAKKFNLDLSSIIKCCRGKKKTCGGMKWNYV